MRCARPASSADGAEQAVPPVVGGT